ncbi:MAG: hypothetical protein RL385_2876 [Pseudomonadota bacterium]|jgi:hypothetical protein
MLLDFLLRWIFAFLFTQAVEVPIYKRMLGVTVLRAFGASAITHPLLWFVVFPQLSGSYTEKVVVSELLVWLSESLYFAAGAGTVRALKIAFLANGLSLALGLLSRALIGLP